LFCNPVRDMFTKSCALCRRVHPIERGRDTLKHQTSCPSVLTGGERGRRVRVCEWVCLCVGGGPPFSILPKPPSVHQALCQPCTNSEMPQRPANDLLCMVRQAGEPLPANTVQPSVVKQKYFAVPSDWSWIKTNDPSVQNS
jgi:hypothetical protein